MPLCYDTLPGQLRALLQAGHRVTVRWNCGSDDSFVTTQLDGVEQPHDLGVDYYDTLCWASREEYDAYLTRITSLPVLLDGFLTERLRLPSVGEFSLQGGGRLLLQDGAIVLEYQSEAANYVENPDGWWPEEYLDAAGLAELCPERLQAGAPEPPQLLRQPDPGMAARYSGRVVLFHLS